LDLWRFDVAVPRALVTNEIEAGAKMKFAVAILFSVGLIGLSSGQQNPSSSHAVATPVGLDTGRQAPAFALTDQFGHQQSNETLKGSKGIVLLFFRSADW
jgi:cytochrome oxidase Cu insertion factor (SCO1/SenC/PrrC family)